MERKRRMKNFAIISFSFLIMELQPFLLSLSSLPISSLPLSRLWYQLFYFLLFCFGIRVRAIQAAAYKSGTFKGGGGNLWRLSLFYFSSVVCRKREIGSFSWQDAILFCIHVFFFFFFAVRRFQVHKCLPAAGLN